MSSTTKKKHVTKEVLEEYPLPEEGKQIVKVTAARGNNLHEVLSSSGETFLVSMPPKFRKHVWIKRGDFIMIEPIEEGDKVKGEICHILFKEQIKHIQENDLWPESFTTKSEAASDSMIPDDLLPPSSGDESDGEDLADLVVNLNRVNMNNYESSESEDASEDEDDENDCTSEHKEKEENG